MLRFTPAWVGVGLLAVSLPTACGDTAAGPVERPSVPPLELSLSNEDGFIDRSGVFGVFSSAAEGFAVGDGGNGKAEAFVFRLSVTNQSAFGISDIIVTDEIAPHTGIAICREVLVSTPDGFDNPSLGTVAGGNCSPDGFVWEIGILGGGESADLFFRAEAVDGGGDVNRVRLSAESVSELVLNEQPFLIGPSGATAELDLANESGFIDRSGLSPVFDSAKEHFSIGDGSDTRPDALVYQVAVTNQSSTDAHGLRIVDAVGPDGRGIAFREILETAPDRGSNPTLGTIDRGTCSPSGFTWRIGTLDAGNTATVYFRAEALEEGTPVNRVVLVGGALPFPAVLEEPTAVLGN